MAKTPLSLTDALKAYDKAQDMAHLQAVEEQRTEFLKRFPMSKWSEMQLEDYALGVPNSEEGFSCWLEFHTTALGSIKGGAASKHLVYKRKNKPGWYFDEKRFSDEQDAWSAIRAGFQEAFEKAQEGAWTEIDEIDALQGGPSVRLKTLYIYFPEELLPVYSRDHLQHFLKLLERPEGDEKTYDVFRFNRVLLHALRERPGFEGWTTKEMERFLYYWADPRETRRIVKIAPGANAKYWQDCLDGSYICVGWDESGDLSDFANFDDFKERFYDVFGDSYNHHKPTLTRKAKEVWTLIQLEPGDLVVANKGTSHILGLGEVEEPGYAWMPERTDCKHTVRVKWDTSFAQEIVPEKRWATTTVAPISTTRYMQFASRGTGGLSGAKVPVDATFMQIAEALEQKGQVVLYGPPGTGKTYTARRFAVWWLMRELERENPESVLADDGAFREMEEDLATGQIAPNTWWVVANPNEWSWEELFKSGSVKYRRGRLQRNYPLVRRGDLVVGYQASPDKRLVAIARVARELHAIENGDLKIELEPVCKIDNGPTFEGLMNDEILSKSEPMINRSQGTLFALCENEANYLLAMLEEQNPRLAEHRNPSGTNGSLTILTFHASYSYEDFVEGIRPVQGSDSGLSLRLQDGVFKTICREAQANPDRPYVVLIDEINRANVAKVFGELITLLERDKRDLQITLPQSREAFTVPKNVYVLATMNTADRSIKLLDAAFRRRFAFLEFMPDSAVLAGGKVGNLALDEFLDELNARIARTEGREKQIGHSYLLDKGQPITDPDEFARRFRQEILPLLQEYCYDEYATLARYIGNELVDESAQQLDLDRVSDTDQLLVALQNSFPAEGRSQ